MILPRPSNPQRELADYCDRVDRMFGDLEPRPCTGCGAETLPEQLNRAGQCASCGPADPKPHYETLQECVQRLKGASK